MAHDNKEIEIRFSLTENGFLDVKKKLSDIAKFVKKTKQVDDYFSPADGCFIKSDFPTQWLSIRRRGGTCTLNYKNWHVPEGADTGTHCDEFETAIESPEQLENIFRAVGIRKLISVAKERETWLFGDEFEVCLDDVEGLGFFVEIEAVGDLGSLENARQKLFCFAGMLGLDKSKTEKIGYVHQLLKKSGMIK